MEIGCFCSHLLKIVCQFLAPTFENKSGNKTLLLYLCILNIIIYFDDIAPYLDWFEKRFFV